MRDKRLERNAHTVETALSQRHPLFVMIRDALLSAVSGLLLPEFLEELAEALNSLLRQKALLEDYIQSLDSLLDEKFLTIKAQKSKDYSSFQELLNGFSSSQTLAEELEFNLSSIRQLQSPKSPSILKSLCASTEACSERSNLECSLAMIENNLEPSSWTKVINDKQSGEITDYEPRKRSILMANIEMDSIVTRLDSRNHCPRSKTNKSLRFKEEKFKASLQSTKLLSKLRMQ